APPILHTICCGSGAAWERFITGNSFAVSPFLSLQSSEGCDKTEILVVGPHRRGLGGIDEHARTMNEDQRNCRSDGWQYGLVSQQVVCAFDYAMRRSSWMHVQGPSSAISHAPRTLQMSHVPNNDD